MKLCFCLIINVVVNKPSELLFMPERTSLIFGSSVSFEALFVVAVIILALAYYIPLKGTWKFIKISLQNKTAEQKISLIKKQLNYPVWQLTGVLGVTFIATLFFVWKIV